MVKKRSPGDGALYYEPGRNLWRGIIDVGFSSDGKRIQKSVRSRTQKGARDKLDALKKEILVHGAPLDKSMPVEQWAEYWLDAVCRPKMKPKPFVTYQSMVRTWIVPNIGRKKVALVKPSDVRSVYLAITSAGRSSSTALKSHIVMSGMFEAARREGKAPRNVVADVDAPKARPVERGALSVPDALKVLSAASQMIDGTRWWVAFLAGLRQGERLGATLDSLNLDRNEFLVQWSLTEATFAHGCAGDIPCGKKRGGACPDRVLSMSPEVEYKQLDGRLCLVRPKSGKPRAVPMIPEVSEALRRYLKATEKLPNPHGLIWRNVDGSPITATQDNQAWRELLLAAGVITEEQAKEPRARAEGTPEPPTSHWARHTTVTILASLGVDFQVIGQIVGQVDAETTHRYRHVSSEEAHRAMAQLGQHLAKGLEA